MIESECRKDKAIDELLLVSYFSASPLDRYVAMFGVITINLVENIVNYVQDVFM